VRLFWSDVPAVRSPLLLSTTAAVGDGVAGSTLRRTSTLDTLG